MKELFDTPFKHEIGLIFNTGTTGPNYSYQVSIHAGPKEIICSEVVGCHKLRDYINRVSDLRSIGVMVTKDQLEYYIHPYQKALEVTVVRTKVSTDPAASGKSKYSNERMVYTFRGVLMDGERDLFTQNNAFVKDKDVMARAGLETVYIQLIDKTYERLKNAMCGGNWRGVVGMDLIETMITRNSKAVSKEADSSILGIDKAAGWNTEPREQIVIDDSTPILNFPQAVSDASGGIYSAGFSYYVQNRIWYFFAPYDPERFHKVQKNLTIINLPKDRLPGVERTYRQSATQVIVLSTGEAAHINHSEANKMNYGNGARFFDAAKLMVMGKMENNRYTIDASKNMNQVVVNPRADENNFAPVGISRITSNKNKELSALAIRQGSFMQYVWENSDDSLLYPGMPIRLLYLDNNKPTETYGCLVSVETYEMPVNKAFGQTKMGCHTALTVFIKHPN